MLLCASPAESRVRKPNSTYIFCQSGSGLSPSTSGAVELQGAGGNWMSVVGRRGGRRVRWQRERSED